MKISLSYKHMVRLFLILFFSTAMLQLSSQNRWEVENENDDGPGSLRYLILQANEGDTITFNDVVDSVRLTSGELLIDKSLNIIGNQQKVCIIRDENLTSSYFRIFHIASSKGNNIVFLSNLQILYGHTPDGDTIDPGAGIYIESDSVIIKKCLIGNNHTGDQEVGYPLPYNEPCSRSGEGGGIYNKGKVYLFDCEITNNKAGKGRAGNAGEPGNWAACPGGNGGGLFNEGYAYLENCMIRNNQAGKGGSKGGGYHSSCSAAKGGKGGGIYNSGDIHICRTVFQENIAGKGGTAGGDHGSYGGNGGEGGALFNAGICNMVLSKIRNNQSGEGGNATMALEMEHGDGGNGGAIYNSSFLTIINSLIQTNKTGKSGGYGGNTGNGGGIYCGDSVTRLINCTLANNRCLAENDQTSSTRQTNSRGGGVMIDNATIYIDNTIIAGNSSEASPEGDDLHGNANSNYSMIKDHTSGSLNGIHNITGMDPGFVQDTSDFHLDIQSIAINTGNPDTTGLNIPDVDLDSLPRIVNQRVDMGVFEFQESFNFPKLSFHPGIIEFNEIGPCDFFIDSLYLSNTGTDTLEIFSLNADQPFYIKRKGQAEWQNSIDTFRLAPFEYDTVFIKFFPPDTGYFPGNVTIHSNDPFSEYYLIPLSGIYYGCMELSGVINQDTILRSYCIYIVGDLTIPDGVTLYIEPGCHLKFDGNYRLNVQGNIEAIGANNSKIYFTGILPWEDENELKYWGGIGLSYSYSSFEHCIFEYADPDGAMDITGSNVNITNSIFRFNADYDEYYDGHGGAIYSENSTLTINNSVIHDNKATYSYYQTSSYGGGIYVNNTSEKTLISNVLFYNNSSHDGGGACAYNAVFTNCTFANNSASYGEAIRGSRSIITNSIFYNNDMRLDNNSSVSYSCTTYPSGEGNINEDPQFIDPENINFRLSPSSPCIDAGDPDTANFTVPSFDLDFHPRITNGRIDMGVYEYQSTTPQNIETSPSGFDFGHCSVSMFKIDTLTVYNTGTDLLSVDSITLPEGYQIKLENGDYSSVIYYVEVPGISSKRFIIRFLPEESVEYSGFIYIYSNDPDEPVLSLSVTGVGDLAINEIPLEAIGIFPNPASELVKITVSYPFTRLELFDTQGNRIKDINIDQQEMILLNTSDLSKGLYILRLKDEYYLINRKLIIY